MDLNLPLEKRLEGLSASDSLVKGIFMGPRFYPREQWRSISNYPYLKDDFAEYIARLMQKPEFAGSLKALNKTPLKSVFYGGLSLRRFPAKLSADFNGWELAYLFRGRWEIKKPDFDQSLSKFLIDHMYQGLNQVYADHYGRNSSDNVEREYNREGFQFPQNEEIRRAYHSLMAPEVLQKHTVEKQVDSSSELTLLKPTRCYYDWEKLAEEMDGPGIRG